MSFPGKTVAVIVSHQPSNMSGMHLYALLGVQLGSNATVARRLLPIVGWPPPLPTFTRGSGPDLPGSRLVRASHHWPRALENPRMRLQAPGPGAPNARDAGPYTSRHEVGTQCSDEPTSGEQSLAPQAVPGRTRTHPGPGVA
ncbi:hypothetical protein FALBO_13880 [Fusarium albosuccineum]|uniref:Uncharacterized protein n=1 Tax=Fusarium albosuccineum TaxID=1237068 RepID=A0A8H4PG16_9HYPO|nr:hypothetical protein FALBO_13880 [Fusarium albosuccineum]